MKILRFLLNHITYDMRDEKLNLHPAVCFCAKVLKLLFDIL